MTMRYSFAVALCLTLSWSARTLADESAPAAKEDGAKPALAATDDVKAEEDQPAAKPEAAKPASKPLAGAAPKPAVAPVAPLRGGFSGRRGGLAQPGAQRPVADAARAGLRAAVQAASELQDGEPLGPVDGEGPPDRRPPGPAGPYAPPGGFGDGPDQPPPPEGRRPPPPPGGAAPSPPPPPPPPRGEGGHYDRLLRGGDLNAYDRLTRPMPQRYGTGPDDPEMQKLNAQEAHLEREAREISAHYRMTTIETERDKLRGDLEDIVLQQFEVRQQRRQVELERLEHQLKRLREAIDKRTNSRDELIKQRIEQLVGEESDLGF